jgi:hypothetical protein
MRQANLRSTLNRSAQIALVAASILVPSVASAQWYPSDPYGYGSYGYGDPYGGYGAYGSLRFYYGGRYTIPSDQMHWYSRSPIDFNP